MLQIDYKRCKYDYCVYSRAFDDGHMIILMLYMDDMLIACQDMSKINELQGMLNSEFDMKDLCAAKKIIGWRLRETEKMRGCIFSRQAYRKGT